MTVKTKIKRIIAFCIDWNVIVLIGVALTFIGPQFQIEYLYYPSIKMFSCYGLLLSFLWFASVPLLRNLLFRHASLGKLLLGLRVFDKKTMEKAHVWQVLLRGVTFYISTVDLLLLLIKGETLGDLMTGTVVTERKKKGRTEISVSERNDRY